MAVSDEAGISIGAVTVTVLPMAGEVDMDVELDVHVEHETDVELVRAPGMDSEDGVTAFLVVTVSKVADKVVVDSVGSTNGM